jgi:hypothetical protein
VGRFAPPICKNRDRTELAVDAGSPDLSVSDGTGFA